MNCNDSITKQIYLKLKSEVINSSGQYILLEKLRFALEGVSMDMPAFLQSPEGRAAFSTAMGQLVADNFLAPVGSRPNTISGQYQKYRVVKEKKERDDELVTEIIRSILPPATLDYYLKNPQDFSEDRAIIHIVLSFLKNKNCSLVTVNERAYELFGDEKFFKGAAKIRSRGETVLKRLGLNFSHIGCYETVEPFFSFHKRDFHLQSSRKIYIIENKDTFWSFKQNIMDASSRLKVDMIIYGEGRKILSSFKFVTEYEVDAKTDEVFYFGDFDSEGINIYCELTDEYPEYKIMPFCEGYQAVWEIGLKKLPAKTPKQQKAKADNIERFFAAFRQGAALPRQHLEEGCYIPQEALSAAQMRERFGV